METTQSLAIFIIGVVVSLKTRLIRIKYYLLWVVNLLVVCHDVSQEPTVDHVPHVGPLAASNISKLDIKPWTYCKARHFYHLVSFMTGFMFKSDMFKVQTESII